ncbi:phage tail protein [Alcanivorax sp.]|uniref:phage tail protein n=1 Tax=Alcanivorax sp. TaxID=1872427 RepID=UPI0025BEF55A|nr:phage tail protein [Alcanivorax sp.]
MSRIVNPKQQFLTTAGLPNSNGTLTFYETGTTTPKDVFSDEDLTVEQSNPYPLNANGQVDADIWLDGQYRVVSKDSDGNTIWTIDDVAAITSTVNTPGGGQEVVQGYLFNKAVNGNFRLVTGDDPTISGTYQEAASPGIFVKAQGTPTNGDVKTVRTTSVGTSGYALQVDDLTTGAGGTVDYRMRFQSYDVRDLVNQTAIFQCAVLHNLVASVDYTVSIFKATAEDNFTATTLIGQSDAISVSGSEGTTISFSTAMGDCSNGVEIVVSAGCGAVSAKDFYFTDVVFRKGAAVSTFEPEPFEKVAIFDAAKRDIGKVDTWPVESLPRGWLVCDGSAVSRTTYAELFARYGTIYGNGDGSTTFNLPDYRGEFLRGWDNGAGIDPDAATRTDRGDGTTGDNVGTKQLGQNEAHDHNFGVSTKTGGANVYLAKIDDDIESTQTTSESGGDEARPRNVYVVWACYYGWRSY